MQLLTYDIAIDILSKEGYRVYVLDGTIRLSPPRSITRLRGIAKGMRWKNEDRDHSERF